MSAANDAARPRDRDAATPKEVVWHDLECGSYRVDLTLWRELAERHPGSLLDVGAGTGRVALDLARAGHDVTAVDLDSVLLGALRERAAQSRVEAVCADARSLELTRRDFSLCLAPMQTIQLLGGSAQRGAFLRRARAHLRPGGLLACAILARVEPFDCADGQIGPPPERTRLDGLLYVSRPTRVALLERTVVIERDRRVFAPRPTGATVAAGDEDAGVELSAEHDVIALDRVSAAELEREAIAAGLRPEPARDVPSTADHAGSTVVMLRA
ncbi:MAG: class I SAM-dependent methyltransferase [Solirubrobacterales bacterium]